jgi:hypothetical protein
MKKQLNIWLLFSFTLCLFSNSIAQTDSIFQYTHTLKGVFNSFTIDKLENIYTLSATGQLKKTKINGDSIGVFNELKKYGQLEMMDASNPLKLLLFYKDFSIIVVLDRNLNILNVINLRNQHLYKITTIATSYDNHIWIYDDAESKLKKIDDQGQLLSETVDFRSILDSVPSPVQIIDEGGFVYLYDPEKGFYIFDYYGTLKNRLPYLNWLNTAVVDKIVYGFNGGQLFQYKTGSFDLKTYKLPNSMMNFKEIRAVNNKLLVLNNSGIEIYRIR